MLSSGVVVDLMPSTIPPLPPDNGMAFFHMLISNIRFFFFFFFLTGEWISATVSECTGNCSGISN